MSRMDITSNLMVIQMKLFLVTTFRAINRYPVSPLTLANKLTKRLIIPNWINCHFNNAVTTLMRSSLSASMMTKISTVFPTNN